MGSKIKFPVDSQESEDLAAALCNIDSDETEKIEGAFFSKYGIELGHAHDLIQDIFQMLSIGISPLTFKPYIGFSKQEKSIGFWLIKRDCEGEFISAVLDWLTEGGEFPEGVNGYTRDITSENVPEFEITIKKHKND